MGASTLLGRVRYRVQKIVGVVVLMVLIFWGADLAFRIGLHWTQVVWLFISAGIVALVSLPLLVPLTFGIDKLVQPIRSVKWARYFVYGLAFVLIGAGVSVLTGAISLVAAMGGGLASGLLIAKVCEEPVTVARSEL